MRILYIAFVRLPTDKAHGLQIMKVCEALANAGAEVELLLPGRKTPITEDAFTYYGVKKNFSIVNLHTPDLMRFDKLGFVLSQFSFGFRASLYAQHHPGAVVISQDEWTLGRFIAAKHPVVYEVHNGRWNLAAQRAAKAALLLVANSSGTKRFYVEHGIPDEKIIVMPNGVDLERFNPSLTKEEARTQLNLPQDKKLVVYTGHLYDWKGAHTLAESTHDLPENTEVVFVGGTERDVAAFRERYGSESKVRILGHRPNADIPLYLRAADVLVLPNDRIGESEQFTSPMKLFEYMAAEKPIVASDLPSVREVLDDASAFFFTPGDSTSLSTTLTRVLENAADAESHAHSARARANTYTWNRAELLHAIESRV